MNQTILWFFYERKENHKRHKHMLPPCRNILAYLSIFQQTLQTSEQAAAESPDATGNYGELLPVGLLFLIYQTMNAVI